LAYAVVAWIWAFIWHLPLDLVKWAIAYTLNEDGFRDRAHGRDPASMLEAEKAEAAPVTVTETGEAGPSPPLQRTSLGRNSLGRNSGGRPSIGRNSVQGAFIKGSAGPGAFGRMSQASEDPRNKSEINYIAGGQQTWQNPAGRVSVQFAPGALERASVVDTRQFARASATGGKDSTGIRAVE
jgi:hypothetical protein